MSENAPINDGDQIEAGAIAIWELRHKRMGGTISWAQMKAAIDADPDGYQASTWAFEDCQADAKACLEAAYPLSRLRTQL